ncbi:hypothetical protein K4K59_006683 [Colletotrichum sp. SAR11_240]|nr:hypothetical protein K4K59_006683 [Colletotrichum sp. SAR11_240]
MRSVQGRLPVTNIVLAEEQDAEDQKEDRDVTIDVPEETDFADAAFNYIEAAADIPYATAAKIAMNLMMSHGLGQYRLQGMETCALCEENDSVDDEKKRHTYTVEHLREHVASDFHTPYKQWIRHAHQDRDARMAADLDDRDFTCPYYTEAAGDSESFKAMKKLTLHRSNSKNIAGKNDWTTPENSAKHDRLKADAGWYDEDWQVDTSSDMKRGTTQRAKTQLAARKIEAQKSDSRKRKFEQPVPVPGQSGIVWAQPGQVVGEDLENPGSGIILGCEEAFRFEVDILRHWMRLLGHQSSNATLATRKKHS